VRKNLFNSRTFLKNQHLSELMSARLPADFNVLPKSLAIEYKGGQSFDEGLYFALSARVRRRLRLAAVRLPTEDHHGPARQCEL